MAPQITLDKKIKHDFAKNDTRHWLIPVDIYAKLNEEFHFSYDPCPCPKPYGYNALTIDWGEVCFVNPPFHNQSGIGPTAFVRKAIEEHKKGKTIVLTLPTQSYVNLLLDAGAECRSLGRVPWRDVDTGKPMRNPSPITCFILRGRQL